MDKPLKAIDQNNNVAVLSSVNGFLSFRDRLRSMLLESPEAEADARKLWDVLNAIASGEMPARSSQVDSLKLALNYILGRPAEYRVIEGKIEHEVSQKRELDIEAIRTASMFIDAEFEETSEAETSEAETSEAETSEAETSEAETSEVNKNE